METATATTENTPAGTEQEPDTTGQQKPQTTPPAGQEPTGERLEDLPPWAQKVIRDARAGEAKARTEAKATAAAEAADQARQELAQKIGKAIGLIKDDQEQADPAQVAQQVSTLTADLRSRDVALAIWRNADALGADAKALEDSKSFTDRLAKLDPASPDFANKVKDLMKRQLDEHPHYRKAGQAPARSGGEFTGGPGGDAVTPEQFKRMSVAQRHELFQRDPTLYRKLAGR